MIALSRVFLMVLIAIPLSSRAQSGAEKSTYLMCRNLKSIRTIRVVESSEQCTTLYTKNGVDESVASGKNKQSCYNVMANIRKNIEGAGWKCKDISAAKVTEKTI